MKSTRRRKMPLLRRGTRRCRRRELPARVGRLGTSRVVRVSAGRLSRARGVDAGLGLGRRHLLGGRLRGRRPVALGGHPRPEPRAGSANDADALARLRVKGDDAASNTTAVENANTGELVRDFLARGRRRDRVPRLQRQVSLGETRAVGGARGSRMARLVRVGSRRGVVAVRPPRTRRSSPPVPPRARRPRHALAPRPVQRPPVLPPAPRPTSSPGGSPPT